MSDFVRHLETVHAWGKGPMVFRRGEASMGAIPGGLYLSIRSLYQIDYDQVMERSTLVATEYRCHYAPQEVI